MISLMGRLTRRHPVVRLTAEGERRRIDVLAVEEPLELRINGEPFVVTMRTPGNDLDLVHGLLHAEGLITGVADVSTARYCGGVGEDGENPYNQLDLALAAGVAPPTAEQRRQVFTSSACGLCGATSIDQVLRDGRYELTDDLRIDRAVIAAAPDRLREQQRAFDKTGGLHGAALMDAAGGLACVREDVGRHNAVDKVIGWALREDRLPARDLALVVSGRASFELTQKAVLAGIAMLIAVSAPSSLAVELAERSGLTLAGFVRGGSMNLYTHPDRVLAARSSVEQ